MQPEVDVEVYVVQAWKIFLSLTVGIFGGVCITIIVLLCWKKVFKKVTNLVFSYLRLINSMCVVIHVPGKELSENLLLFLCVC